MLDKILVVDDEPEVTGLVARHLSQAGFKATTAADGLSALAQIQAQAPALIVLDLMLPELNGTEVIRRLKADKNTTAIPILILTARSTEEDRVRGLELGVDDYMTKPFSPRELVVRVKRILQRTHTHTPLTEVMKCGLVLLDLVKHEVRVDGQPINLTVTEFNLLHTLLRVPGYVQTRPELIAHIYSTDPEIGSRTIDAHVRRLRQKLGQAGDHIETVRGVGYRFADH